MNLIKWEYDLGGACKPHLIGLLQTQGELVNLRLRLSNSGGACKPQTLKSNC